MLRYLGTVQHECGIYLVGIPIQGDIDRSIVYWSAKLTYSIDLDGNVDG